MDNLPFVIWILLFPVCSSIADYFDAKAAEIKKEEHTVVSKKQNKKIAGLMLLIWICVSILLYHRVW